MMRDEIEQHVPKVPSLVALGERRVRAFVGDMQPALHSTLWVGDTPTRIVSLAGGQRVEAITFDTSGFAVGDAVRCSPEDAAWPAPRAGRTELTALAFEPGRLVALPQARPDERPLVTGIEVIDSLLPVVRRGVTLLLDCGAPDACTDRILSAFDGPVVCASPREVPAATHQIADASGLGLTVAAQWAKELDAVLLIEAPPFDVDALLDASTPLTCVVRIHLRDGLEILAESLDLGHSETQVLLRPDGTIDLARSASRRQPATDQTARLQRLAEIRERLAIFGEFELSDEDREILAEAEPLESGLCG